MSGTEVETGSALRTGYEIPSIVQSVNLHFTSRCNYRCTFCCKCNLDGDLTSLEEARIILQNLQRLAIDKINFVGGEPFCHPLIIDLIILAKEMGFTTSVITNGSLLTEEKLKRIQSSIDWIGISIDSASEEIEKELGRGNGTHVANSIRVAGLIRKYGIKLKINTTVTRQNINEDLRPLIGKLAPDRWKVFQFLHIPGQNDSAVEMHAISNDEFNQYKARNSSIVLSNGRSPVFESSEVMMDSYFMLSPSGNVIINTRDGTDEIALEKVTPDSLPKILNLDSYISRGALYDWK